VACLQSKARVQMIELIQESIVALLVTMSIIWIVWSLDPKESVKYFIFAWAMSLATLTLAIHSWRAL